MRTRYGNYFLAFIVPVILYIQTVGFGFTSFDDNRLIKENQAFLSDIGNVLNAFRTDAFISGTSYFYRPLQNVSYMTDILIAGGVDARMSHLTNVILFGLISSALYGFIRIFITSSLFALIITLLFAVHPLFVSSVAWIPARGDLFLALFTLISFTSLHYYICYRRTSYLIIHIMAFVFALFSKETAAVLPVIFIIYYLIKNGGRFPGIKYFFIPASYLLTGLAWFWMRSAAIEVDSSVYNADELVGLIPFFRNLRIIPEGLFKFILPVYPDPIPSFSIAATLGGIIILVTLVVFTLMNKSRPEIRIISVAWFILLMLPPMLFKHRLIDYLDHRLLLPLIGLLPLMSFFESYKPGSEIFKRRFRWACVALILLFAGLTFSRTRIYKDPYTFYTRAVNYNPASSIAHNNLGAIYHNRGNYKLAIGEYSSAISIKKDYINAINNRANAYFLSGSFSDAISDYTKVISMDPYDANAFNSRGVAYLRNRQTNEACNDFQKAAQIGSSSGAKNYSRFCGTHRN